MPDSRRLLPPLLVVLAVLAAFLPSLDNGFIAGDDTALLLDNPGFRGLAWENLKWMFGGIHFGSYAPLAWLSLAFDHLLWGLDPAGLHLTSLLIHAGNALLVYRIALELAESPAGAAFAALFFALHPLRVESVVWAAERRDVLCGFFSLMTVLLYVRRSRAAPGTFALALLSKGSAVSLPAVLLVLDVYPLRRLAGDPRRWLERACRDIWVEKLLYVIPALAAAAVGWAGQAQLGEIPRYQGVGPAERLAQACYGLAFYVWKTVLPLKLLPLYPRPRVLDPNEARFVLSGLAVLAVTGVLIALRKRWPAGLAAWACYAAMLVPVLGLVPFGPQLVADRYSYLSCVGFALLAGAALAKVPESRAWAVVPAAVVLAALASLTWRQTQVWRDTETFWAYQAAADPSHAISRNWLGVVRSGQGRTAQAKALYEAALKLDPEYAAAHNNLANLLANKGRLEEAVRHYREAARLSPGHVALHFNWGEALFRQGKNEEAARQFREELMIDPSSARAKAALKRALSPPGPRD